MSAERKPVHGFTFGPLSFQVTGDGVWRGQDAVRRHVADQLTTVDALKRANREAWKQKRAATIRANRYSNVSMYGWAQHDAACLVHDVADAVCKATWAAMQGAASHG